MVCLYSKKKKKTKQKNDHKKNVGSSNIDANVSIGTIFGVFKVPEGDCNIQSLLQPGNKMIAAGYCVYGSATVMGTNFCYLHLF
jgi:hypothetical protein